MGYGMPPPLRTDFGIGLLIRDNGMRRGFEEFYSAKTRRLQNYVYVNS